MSETTKKSSYARPHLNRYGGLQQLTLLQKTTTTPSDGSYLTFSDSNPPQPSGSCLG